MKTQVTKLFVPCFILFSVILITFSACNTTVKISQTDVDSIVSLLVPDQRVDICRIRVEKGKHGELMLSGETTNPGAKQKLIKTLNDQGISLIDSILNLPDTLKDKKYFGLVSISVSNLRKQPDHRSEMVSQAILGTPVRILKSEDAWLLVQTPDRYIAWTEESSVKRMNGSEISSWKNAVRVIFLENYGWIYGSESLNSGVVGDLVAGCIMEKTGESKDFVSIVLPDGREGFVKKSSVSEFDNFCNRNQPDEEKIIQMASSLLGIPYLWGGTSTKGVDCSGFVRTVYFLNGLILMRDASQQALHGDPVDISNGFVKLRKGDLLFFGSKVNLKPHVTHVAIYKGDDEYINSSGMVMINSLDSTSECFSSSRLHALLSARRILGVSADTGIVSISKHLWYWN